MPIRISQPKLLRRTAREIGRSERDGVPAVVELGTGMCNHVDRAMMPRVIGRDWMIQTCQPPGGSSQSRLGSQSLKRG
ncbi:hypothetical protein GCM10010191_52840 [Actinomadura vinacea]|uniref:Uncharacterized protein n=1 Tax=Actinomadura vinacea TaxID=115336 RepID=A0ABP5WS32_9ACTN